MLVAALILSICSVALPIILCIPVGLPILVIGVILGVVSIILAVVGRKKEPEKKGMATASLVLGIIGTVLSGIFLISVAVVAAGAAAIGNAMMNNKDLQDAVDAANKALEALNSPSPAAQ